jgi:hypothetical protein
MAAKTSIESKLSKLNIDLPKPSMSRPAARRDTVADSWEDDDFDDDSSTQTPTDGTGQTLNPVKSEDPALNPPPPTPISAGAGGQYVDWSPAQVLGGGRPTTRPFSPQSDSDQDRRRPEKTTAAAGRMIAAGLGVKAPKKTEEQRQYDRSVREQEMKRRNKEKQDRERERQDDEKAKAAIWDS